MYLKTVSLAAAIVTVGAFAIPPRVCAQVSETYGTIAEHEWIASGFVGPAFGADAEDANTGFGGAISYLRYGAFGGEFLANFTPDMQFASDLIEDSAINHYMFNGMAALPLGRDARWQPFVSAGFGAMTISGAIEDPDDFFDFDVDDTQLAGNVGFGLMGFGDRWGFRAGARYFAGLDDDPNIDGDINDTSDLVDPADILGDVSFWRVDGGVAYRW